ncbi:hypothetical protein TSUD_371620 [Trifolium subterraneum]|uniref:Reticulon domain-containing protein n=1 Tax=Trifolium subterraneum TaxID=3900 RepID=A0A2Z6P0Y7_TRISU|nr:hypothetical protein TSUD_371620 [Trifolium subterraneum]
MEFNISKRTSVVAAGSVWETRMKNDEVKGGIKVFKAQEQKPDQDVGDSKLRRTSIGSSKRKTWSPIQISKGKPEEQCSSSSSDGIKKTPIRNRKIGDKFQRSPIQSRKIRSDDNTHKGSGEAEELRKIKSDPINKNHSGSVTDSIELRKSNSELDRVQDNEPKNEVDELDDGFEKLEAVNDENCEDFDVCQEKEISNNVGVVQNSPELMVKVIGEGDDDDVVDEVVDEEIQIAMENESFDVKEITIPENNNVVLNHQENKKVVNESEEPKKIVNAQMRFHHKNERRSVSVPIAVKQSPTIRRNSTIYQNFSKPNSSSSPKEEEHSSFPQTQSKLQSLVDLIMWRDVSRSAFVFGIGTFIIISSSYARDINLSLISAISYVGLVYLAVIFLYRSLICRGVIDVDDSNYVLGEKDAIWMLKLVLPYLNEFLSKLKALFSGDPGTTMKASLEFLSYQRSALRIQHS